MNRKSNVVVEIDGVKYNLNVKMAVENGYLKEIHPLPLKFGDVYIDPRCRYVPMLLVAVTNKPDDSGMYQLLGGASRFEPFSDSFFSEVHTKKEIEEFLEERGMKFSHNVNNEMEKLFYPKLKESVQPV